MHGSLLGSKHLPVVGVNVASIPAGGLSVVAVAAIDGSNANTRRWNGGMYVCLKDFMCLTGSTCIGRLTSVVL